MIPHKKHMTCLSKIILSILACVMVFFAWKFLLIFFVLSKTTFYPGFYPWLVTAASAAALMLFFMKIWDKPRIKIRHAIALCVMVATVTTVVVFEICKAHRAGLEIIKSEINLSLYAPFGEDTFAASLDAPSALRLKYNLPKLDGATALYPLYSAFAMAVYPEDELRPESNAPINFSAGYYFADKQKVVCTNTRNAYKRLICKETDMIFAAGPSAKQLEAAREKDVEMKLTPIGREAFVFFVNAKNPINGLSAADIKKIYSGEAKNWKEFGGKNTAIQAFQRPPDSGSQTAIVRFMGDTPLMPPPTHQISQTMGGIIDTVSEYRNHDNAIGYTFLYFATEMVRNNKIKLLAIDGIAPTRESVADGAYPLSADFYAVTAGSANPNIDAFLEWILSEQGQLLVEKTGYTPLSPPAAPDFRTIRVKPETSQGQPQRTIRVKPENSK